MNFRFSILTISLIGCFASCSSPKKEKLDSKPSDVKIMPSDPADTSSQTGQRIDNKAVAPERRVDSLLMEPLDLVNYKRKKGMSNSGGGSRKAYHFRPDTAGMYYRYFLFHLPQENKYLGKDINIPLTVSRNSGGREILVFKPDDADKYNYDDPNEILLEFTQWFNDTDLPELAYVGWTKSEILGEFGKPDFTKANSIVYTFQDRVLLFKLNFGRVDWLKYARTNAPFDDSPKYQALYEKDVFGM